jgi:general secretion pathway protein D
MRRFYDDDPEQRRFIDYDRKLGPFARIQRGVGEELGKIENGGAGAAGERLIGSPAQTPPPGGPPTPSANGLSH